MQRAAVPTHTGLGPAAVMSLGRGGGGGGGGGGAAVTGRDRPVTDSELGYKNLMEI